MKFLTGSLFIVFLSFSSAFATEIHFTSSGKQTTLIELFTSQGCSSCPPAERFLNRLTQHPQLWQTYIPVAFHVDYWDYLGWKDRFARSEYSLRQRRYAKLQRARTVYTPAFFVNGKTWRPGLFFKTAPVTETAQAGQLAVSVSARQLTAQFTSQQAQADKLLLNIALLGMELSTQIQAGENQGKHSQHEFVVLTHQTYQANHPRWIIPWREISQQANDQQAPRHALAVWVSQVNNPVPLQATGGYLPSSFLVK